MEKELFKESVEVHCAGAVMVPVGEVRKNPDNPNVHPDDQLEMMGQILRAVGWREALVVSKRSGLLVKGHGRLAAAEKLGLEAVPVEYQDYASEDQELADMIGDNRVSQHSYMDALGLGKLLRKMDASKRDALGYSGEEVGLLMASEFVPAKPTDRTFRALETLKMTKEQKGAVGHAVQTYCLRLGREVEWGEALANICVQWETGAPAQPTREAARSEVSELPESDALKSPVPEPETREVSFKVDRVAGTTVGELEVWVVRPKSETGSEAYYTQDEELVTGLRQAREQKSKVRATVSLKGKEWWIDRAEVLS